MPTCSRPLRLLAALVLSQTLVVQALLLGWSGALSAAGAPAGSICTASDPLRTGSDNGPAVPPDHHDCASACLAGQGAEPPRLTSLANLQPGWTLIEIEPGGQLSASSRTAAFLARAPPALI